MNHSKEGKKNTSDSNSIRDDKISFPFLIERCLYEDTIYPSYSRFHTNKRKKISRLNDRIDIVWIDDDDNHVSKEKLIKLHRFVMDVPITLFKRTCS